MLHGGGARAARGGAQAAGRGNAAGQARVRVAARVVRAHAAHAHVRAQVWPARAAAL